MASGGRARGPQYETSAASLAGMPHGEAAGFTFLLGLQGREDEDEEVEVGKEHEDDGEASKDEDSGGLRLHLRPPTERTRFGVFTEEGAALYSWSGCHSRRNGALLRRGAGLLLTAERACYLKWNGPGEGLSCTVERACCSQWESS